MNWGREAASGLCTGMVVDFPGLSEVIAFFCVYASYSSKTNDCVQHGGCRRGLEVCAGYFAPRMDAKNSIRSK